MTLQKSIRGFISGNRFKAIRPKVSSGTCQFSPVGLLFDNRTKSVITNSRPGHLQFYDPENDKNNLLLDVAGENYLTHGTKAVPVTEVIKADITCDGIWLTTVQSRGDLNGESTIKIWLYDSEKSKHYQVNTVSAKAHAKTLTVAKFSTSSSVIPSLEKTRQENQQLLTASEDGVFRIWRLTKNEENETFNWVNSFSSNYHSMPINDGDWSSDGSLIALASGPHAVLIDSSVDLGEDDAMKNPEDSWILTALTACSDKNLSQIKFGRGTSSSNLIASSKDGEGFVCIWNLSNLQSNFHRQLQHYFYIFLFHLHSGLEEIHAFAFDYF